MSSVVAAKAKHRERHRQPRIVHLQETFICLFLYFFFLKRKKEVLKLGTDSYSVQEIPN